MKLQCIIISAVLLFSLRAKYTFAEERGMRQPALLLSDSTAGFPVLKGLFEAGFFKDNCFLTQYIQISEINNMKISGAGDLRLISELKDKGDVKYSLYNLFFTDSIKQNISILWEVPAGDKHRRDSSIRTIIDFAKNANDSTVPEAFVQSPGFSGAVEAMDVRYKDNSLNGYDLTVHTGFSQTHRFIRTLGEICFLNSFGVANYWINKEANMEDWRYKYRWKDVWPRFRDGWAYDTNAFRTNTLYHFYAGSIYYQTARSNEYGVLASTAWAFTGSFIWEYIGEWREQTSANDMVFTTFGGALLGEALCQSSTYVERCLQHSVYGSILAFLLDPMRIINRALDRCFDGSYKVGIIFVNPAAQAIIEKSR